MFIKLVRIGRDAELRQVGGKSVLNVSVAYDVGYGQNKQTQWMRLALWGDRADKVASHFTKGKWLVIRADDLQVRTFQGKDGTQASLEAPLVGFDFVSDSRRDDGGPTPSRMIPICHSDHHTSAPGSHGSGVFVCVWAHGFILGSSFLTCAHTQRLLSQRFGSIGHNYLLK